MVSRCAQVLLYPVDAAATGVDAVSYLRDHALQADLAGVREQLSPVDLEAFAELDVGAGDDLLELGLALEERQLPEVAAVEIEEGRRRKFGPVPSGALGIEAPLFHKG
jgi:hypothetical protein